MEQSRIRGRPDDSSTAQMVVRRTQSGYGLLVHQVVAVEVEVGAECRRRLLVMVVVRMR